MGQVLHPWPCAARRRLGEVHARVQAKDPGLWFKRPPHFHGSASLAISDARPAPASAQLSSARWRSREAALTGLSIFAVAATGLIVTYTTARASLLAQIRTQIRQSAALAASDMDPQLHATLTRPEQMDGADYRRAATPLLHLRQAVPEITYAYTLIPGPTGPRFVLDSSRFIRNPGDTSAVAGIGEVYAEAPEAALAALRSGQTTVSRSPYTDRWGTFLSGYAPFRDPSGRVAGVVGIDISLARLQSYLKPLRLSLTLALVGSGVLAVLSALARWRALLAQARALDEFGRSRELAERAAAAADAANRAKDTFLATVSHEIRTPLNGVIGLTGIVLSTQLSDRQRDCLETAKSSAQSLLTILNDILDFSAIEAGSLRLNLEKSRLRPLLEEVVDLGAAQAHGRGTELTLTVDSGVPETIDTDALRLRQILLNLVTNAIQSTAQGGVELSVAQATPGPAEHRLIFAVRDTGPGIPAEELERLFLPFHHLDPTVPLRSTGSGLGLVISQRLANALGGEIRVESAVGKGSLFVLSLPMNIAKTAPEDVGDLPEPSRPPDPSWEEGLPLAGLSLLVVSSCEPNRRLLLGEIQRGGGQAQLAASPGELTALLKKHVFDLAIIDLPVTKPRQGFPQKHVVADIRAQQLRADLPLVVCCPIDEEVGRDDQAVCLAKPIKRHPLHHVLTTALSQRKLEVKGSNISLPIATGQVIASEDFARLHPLRILVAEDNIINRRVCELMLRRLGYEAEFVIDGVEAVKRQRTLDPDLILMDLSMPRLDGLAATRRIRSQQLTAHRPWIVAVTAHSLQGDRTIALESGMDDFLSKPIDESELTQALRRGHAALRS